MDSNSYNPRYEDALKLFDIGKDFYDNNSYQKASLYLDKALDLKPPYPAIYYLKSECAVNLKDYKNALKTISEGLELIDNTNDRSGHDILYQIKFLHQRYKIYIAIDSNEKAQADLEQIKNLIMENYKSGAITQEQYDALIQEIEIKVNDTANSISHPKVNKLIIKNI